MNKLIITLPHFIADEAIRIVKFLNQGSLYVHIRKPEASEADLRCLIEAIPTEYRARLTLHDHLHLAAEYGLGGVHLNARNPIAPDGFKGRISCSCHSLEQLDQHPDADYMLISPLFESISKPGYAPKFSPEEVRLKIAMSGLKGRVYALGGVTPDKFSLLEEYGFAGAAMLGRAWMPVDAEKFRLQYITQITDANNPIDSLVNAVRHALKGGCRWIQLRMKEASADDIIKAAHIIEPLCRTFNATFLLDDHVELVAETKADGVHLGKNDMPVVEARKILGPGYIIGATANTFEDIRTADEAGADYIGLGPFRFTTTKKNLSPTLGAEGYRSILKECRQTGIQMPVVAIGGILKDDVAALLDAGADGIAVSGAIAAAHDPEEATKEFIRILRKL